MEFISGKFSGFFKIILSIAAVLIFMRVFPYLIVLGVIAYGGIRLVKYFKSERKIKFSKKEKFETKAENIEEQDYYDLSNKNVVDVDYVEVKR